MTHTLKIVLEGNGITTFKKYRHSKLFTSEEVKMKKCIGNFCLKQKSNIIA